jgi:hypothetical protein
LRKVERPGNARGIFAAFGKRGTTVSIIALP